MILTEKIVNRIFKIATGSQVYKILFAPLMGIIFASTVTFLIFFSLYLDSYFKLPSFIPHPYNWIGLLFFIPGLFLSLWSIYNFLIIKGTPVPLSPPPKLVVSGPYKYSRNPMTTGGLIQIFGFGIICNSIIMVFITVPLLILINYLELKNIEEPELEKRLGQGYVDYKKRVPMFFPWRKLENSTQITQT